MLEMAQHVALVVWVLTEWVASHVEQLQVSEAHQVGCGRQLRQAVLACRGYEVAQGYVVFEGRASALKGDVSYMKTEGCLPSAAEAYAAVLSSLLANKPRAALCSAGPLSYLLAMPATCHCNALETVCLSHPCYPG